MGMNSLLGLAFTPKLIKNLMGDGNNDAVKQAIADYDKERQEKEKSAQESAMSGRPSMAPGMNMAPGMKRGGAVKKMAKGGSVSSASKRADGCAQRGKTRGKMC